MIFAIIIINYNNYNNNKYFITNQSYTNVNNNITLSNKKNRTDDTYEVSKNGSIDNSTESTSNAHYIVKKLNIYDELFPVNNMVNSSYLSNEGCRCNKSLTRDKSIQNRRPKIRLEMRDIKYITVMDTEMSTNNSNEIIKTVNKNIDTINLTPNPNITNNNNTNNNNNDNNDNSEQHI